MTYYEDIEWYIGIDEAGRGPLAGPVTLGFFAVTSHGLRHDDHIKQLLLQVRDSKQLSEKQRAQLFEALRKTTSRNPHLRLTTASVSAEIIEAKGISYAIKSAIMQGLKRLGFPTDEAAVILDGGLKAPSRYEYQETIIKGDETEPLISAASILAKVTRDNHMLSMHKKFPQYGFAQHKGYGTKQHREAIKRHGMCQLHRASWVKA